jgi:hypothetical protein
MRCVVCSCSVQSLTGFCSANWLLASSIFGCSSLFDLAQPVIPFHRPRPLHQPRCRRQPYTMLYQSLIPIGVLISLITTGALSDDSAFYFNLRKLCVRLLPASQYANNRRIKCSLVDISGCTSCTSCYIVCSPSRTILPSVSGWNLRSCS